LGCSGKWHKANENLSAPDNWLSRDYSPVTA
jgi:hypothetical protein